MENEDLLIITLNQLGVLKEIDPTQQIQSVSQLNNDQFREILIKLINKIIQLKNMDVQFPEKASHEMSKKYQEAQKIVEFLKSIGFRGDLGMNKILFPPKKDMEHLIEFTVEIISSAEGGGAELGGVTEKNLVKIKIDKVLNEWQKDIWIIPELNINANRGKNTENENYFLKVSEAETKQLRSIAKNSGVDKEYITNGKETLATIATCPKINIIQEEDNQFAKYTQSEKNHNYLVNKLKKKQNVKKVDKTINQLLIESMNKRTKAIQFLYENYKENSFQSNVNIIKRKNKDLYCTELGFNSIQSDSTKKSDQEQEDKQNLYKSKLDTIISNFEEEKRAKNEEINSLNSKLLNLTNSIDNLKQSHLSNVETKNNLTELLDQLTQSNNDLLKEIEDQMTAFEQMKKLEKNEMNENEVVTEVEKLEKKYEDMVTNWTDYANQAKNQILELKTSIDQKKKEYKYKYDQISQLKKEVEEIAAKIAMKQELANFLNDEYSKITIKLNRNIFVNRISDLTKKTNEERKKIKEYLNELDLTNKKIEVMNTNIKKIDNDLEDILFKDAKNNSKLKDVYGSFLNLREGYNNCQKNIIEVSIQKAKLNELQSQMEDYKEKIQNYDIKQLTEQIELLKNANKEKK